MSQAQAPGQPMTQAASQQAGELRDTVQEHAGDVASSARDQVGEVARTARSETQEVVERTRHAVESEARQRTEELAHSVRNVGNGLQALADGRPEEAGPVLDYARNAATRVGDVAQRLEDRGYDGLVADVSNFARRRPGVFLAGAGLLGFAVGRVLRSGGASSAGPRTSEGSSGSASGYAPPSAAMTDATVSMQPVVPRGEPSSIGAGGNAVRVQEIR